MSSGFGLHGGTGRCFPFYQDFAKCMVCLFIVMLLNISINKYYFIVCTLFECFVER